MTIYDAPIDLFGSATPAPALPINTQHKDFERFMRKVSVDLDTDCWIWTAALNTQTGYGRFNFEGFVWYAHRWAWEHLVAPIPDGYSIDHLCRVHACVNPKPHPPPLEPVTPGENARRRVSA